MRISFVLSIILIIQVGCTFKENNSNSNNGNCLNPKFESTISNYIKEKQVFRGIKNTDTVTYFQNYFIVYFHSLGKDNYFTICQSPWPANVLYREEMEGKSPPLFLLFFIDEVPVYIISSKKFEKFGLFSFCKENIDLAAAKIHTSPYEIYDGSFYPMTYKFYKDNEHVIIQKLNEPILNFKSGWKEYENNLKKIHKKNTNNKSEGKFE